MGWCSDDRRHEGYVIGMVPRDFPTEREGPCSVLGVNGSRFQHTDAWPLRELGALGTRDPLHDPGTWYGEGPESRGEVLNIELVHVWYGEGPESRGEVLNIELVHVTCTCGWRSPLQRVRDAQWRPSITVMAPEYEDAAHELWREHIEGKSIDGMQVLARAGKYRLQRLERANVHELSQARDARALRGAP